MITVEAAFDIIRSNTMDFGTGHVPLEAANNRVLKEDWHTDRDLPAYDRVTMDGIAICHDTLEKGIQTFDIEGIAAAGAPKKSLSDSLNCLEVMTGSVLPDHTDTVIRYEDIEIMDGKAHLTVPAVKKGQNIHRKGEDRKKGALIVSQNTVLSPAETGIGATIGKSKIKVANLPRVMVISTGDELVDIDKTPLPHQIRKSNIYTIHALLKDHGVNADMIHLNDDFEAIKHNLNTIINNYQVIILSGGVSKGKYDYVPKALEALGVERLFHKVKQRPGKPFWFGRKKDHCIIFALPGNPVSSFMCMRLYFVDWLYKSLGVESIKTPKAILASDVHFKPDLNYYIQVKVAYNEDGKILAQPIEGRGSGDLANLTDADAFMELPRGKDLYEKGSVYNIYPYRK